MVEHNLENLDEVDRLKEGDMFRRQCGSKRKKALVGNKRVHKKVQSIIRFRPDKNKVRRIINSQL